MNAEPDLMVLFKSTSLIPMDIVSSYAPHPLILRKSCRQRKNIFFDEVSFTQIRKRKRQISR